MKRMHLFWNFSNFWSLELQASLRVVRHSQLLSGWLIYKARSWFLDHLPNGLMTAFWLDLRKEKHSLRGHRCELSSWVESNNIPPNNFYGFRSKCSAVKAISPLMWVFINSLSRKSLLYFPTSNRQHNVHLPTLATTQIPLPFCSLHHVNIYELTNQDFFNDLVPHTDYSVQRLPSGGHLFSPISTASFSYLRFHFHWWNCTVLCPYRIDLCCLPYTASCHWTTKSQCQ